MAKFSVTRLSRNTGRVMKATAALIAAAAFVVASMATPAPDAAKLNEEVFNTPAPVVMTIEEVDEAIVEESTEEEERVRKLSFFQRLKLGFYSLCAACAAWVAHKIPWKKIFNKRNFYILLTLVCLGLAAYYLWPVLSEYLAVESK